MRTDARVRITDIAGTEALVHITSSVRDANDPNAQCGALLTSAVTQDNTAFDAFGRFRTSTPFAIFDSKFLGDKQPLFWDESLSGAASSTFASPEVTLEVTSAAGDAAVRQTFMRFNYQPGKSLLVYVTGLWKPETNVVKRSGIWNGTDGIFYQMSGASASWNIMKGGVITETAAEADWNLGDGHFNDFGTGLSLSTSSVQILYIDYEWLGTGRVRCGFVLSGRPVVAHSFEHANKGFQNVYMNTPNLPLRHEISAVGGAGSMLVVCATVMSEGVLDPNGVLMTRDMGVTPHNLATAGTQYALFGIRIASASAFPTISLEQLLAGISAPAGSNVLTKFSLQFNPTLSSTVTWAALANSALEVGTFASANPVVSAGTTLFSVYAGTDKKAGSNLLVPLANALRLGMSIANVPDTIFVCAQADTGNTSAVAGLQWRAFS